MKKTLVVASMMLWAISTQATQELLVKFATNVDLKSVSLLQSLEDRGASVEELGVDNWVKVNMNGNKSLSILQIQSNPLVEYVQPNYKIKLLEDYSDLGRQLGLAANSKPGLPTTPQKDNPAIPDPVTNPGNGADPLFDKQWGMKDIGVKEAWKNTMGSANMIVAVIDTGVDYTHEDLLPNLWRNAGEMGKDAQGRDKATNGIDDDGNGYIDDVIGWDFAANDNKPYDLASSPWELITTGGNPGHGTHCAGNVAARANNGKGVVGVAPNVKIMSLRFITEKGQGTTADAIKAIKYAVDNGARVLSNSWGSEGEDPAEAQENKALRDAVAYAQSRNVLFIAAAGNGHNGVGYNNDTDAKPGYPASYPHENIISVAALDSSDKLGSFSNWGKRTVHIGAPGVKVFSTTVGSNYSDTVIDMYGVTAYWDGTSMACPHVAGAAALYWSLYPNKTYAEVKNALLSSVRKIPALSGKVVSDGKLDVNELMKH